MWKSAFIAVLSFAGLGVLATQPFPASAQSGPAVRVNNPDQLRAIIDSYTEGATVELTPGDYGALNIRDLDTQGFTITSSNPNNPARFTSVQITNSSGIAFEQVDFDGSASEIRHPFMISGSSDIMLDRIEFTGPGHASANDVRALMIRSSSGVTLNDSSLHGFRNGLELLTVSQIDVLENDFYEIRTDAIRGGGWVDVTIARNLISDIFPGQGEHPDGIQIWTVQQPEASRNVTITGNAILRGAGAPVQGIFLSDQVGSFEYSNMVVEDNLVLGALWNGIYLHHARNVTVSRNVVATEAKPFSAIRLYDVASAVLANNSAQRFNLDPPDGIVLTENSDLGATDTAQLQVLLQQWLAIHPESRAARSDRNLQTQPL